MGFSIAINFYRWINYSLILDEGTTVEFIMKLFAAVFAIAFQMSAPIVATLFLVTLALGITGKTVPQLNIFVVGFPIKIAVGFLVLIITMGCND